jgi:hypothetical protein
LEERKATKEWMTVVEIDQHGDGKLNNKASPSSPGHSRISADNERNTTDKWGWAGAFDSLCFPLELEQSYQVTRQIR